MAAQQSARTSPSVLDGLTADDVVAEATRRRTFAVISHPDAGKSTLTEALALHAHVIAEAGATHGKASRRATVSDWLQMEQERGISISSAALQFTYRDTVFNLLDTPGHADFSEDTYRVLAAVDCAVMLIDAAKGLETQTLKLFDVCRRRGLPVITVINKWDRPGKDALELMDEVQQRTGRVPVPLSWPVGLSGDFRGTVEPRTGAYTRYRRVASGAALAEVDVFGPDEAAQLEGAAWTEAVETAELVAEGNGAFEREAFLAAESTPVLFAAAALNFGVAALLDVLVDLAPPAGPRVDADDALRPVEAPFSGFVFKLQAGMDRAHRDHVAFLRVCSGVFHRGMVLTHAATGKPFATKYAHHVFGRDRETIETAFPGDVVGLVNASALRAGDSVYTGTPVTFPPIPHFSPEHFRVARAADAGRAKQFRRGITQLEHEGVIQVLRSETRGDQAPVLAAVGPMQFEVVADRMDREFGAQVRLEPLPYTLARRVIAPDPDVLNRIPGTEVLRRADGEPIAVFTDKWKLGRVATHAPEAALEPIGGALD
ncbi:peptide chain release factor 3 [Kocuria sp. CPCC 205292]|uniref:peptide chain release factor 3 n=1 Tax=Kocuria cellulosilytica TaxID=3071451 RepID=UPI0034D6C5DD